MIITDDKLHRIPIVNRCPFTIGTGTIGLTPFVLEPYETKLSYHQQKKENLLIESFYTEVETYQMIHKLVGKIAFGLLTCVAIQ